MRFILLALLSLIPTTAALPAAGLLAQAGWDDEEDFAWEDRRGFGFVPPEGAEIVEGGNGQVYMVTVLPEGTTSADPPVKLAAIPGSEMTAADLLKALLADAQNSLPQGVKLLGEAQSITRKVGGADATGWTFEAEASDRKRIYEVFAWVDGGAPRGFVGWHWVSSDGTTEFEGVVSTVRNSVLAYELNADSTRTIDLGAFALEIPLVAAFESRRAADGAYHGVVRCPEVELTLLTSGDKEDNAYAVLKNWREQRATQLLLDASRINATLTAPAPTAMALDNWLLPGQRRRLTMADGTEGLVHDFGLVCGDRVLTITWTTHVQMAAQAQSRVRKILRKLYFPEAPDALRKTKEGRSRHMAGGVTFELPGGMPIAEHADGVAAWQMQTETASGDGPRFWVEVVDLPPAEFSLTGYALAAAKTVRADEAAEPEVVLGETQPGEIRLLGSKRIGLSAALAINGQGHVARFFTAPLPSKNDEANPRMVVVGTVFPRGDQDGLLILQELANSICAVAEQSVKVEGKTWSFAASGMLDLSHYSFAESDMLEVRDPSGAYLEAYATTSLRPGERDLPALEKAIKNRENVADLLLRAEAGNHPDGRHIPQKEENARGFTSFRGADSFHVAYRTWLNPAKGLDQNKRISMMDRAIHVLHTRRADVHIKTVVPADDPQAATSLQAMLDQFEIERPLPHPPRVLVHGGRRILIPQDLPVWTKFHGSNATLTVEPPGQPWSALLFAGFMVPNVPPTAFIETMFEQSATMIGEEIVRGYAKADAEITTELTETEHRLINDQEMSALTVTSLDGKPELNIILAMATDEAWFRQGTLVAGVSDMEDVAQRMAPIFKSAETLPTLIHLGDVHHSLELPIEQWYFRTPIQEPSGWVLQHRSGGGKNQLTLEANGFRVAGVENDSVHEGLVSLAAGASPGDKAPVLEPRAIQLGATGLKLQAPPEAKLIVEDFHATLDVPGGARLELTLLGPDAKARAKSFSNAARRANDSYHVSELKTYAIWRMIAGAPTEGMRFHVERGFVKLVREVHAVECDGFTILVEAEHHEASIRERLQIEAMLDSLSIDS